MYWPPDVRILAQGDVESAKTLVGSARNVLFKALRQQELGGIDAFKLTQKFDNGVIFQAAVIRGLKTLTIYVPPPGEDVLLEQIPPLPPGVEPVEVPVLMLSGWTRVSRSGPLPHMDYRPTPEVSEAYRIPNEFGANKKLGVGATYTSSTDLTSLRPAQFTGTMKRVAQAILGIGTINDTSPGYISGIPPTPSKRFVHCTYRWQWGGSTGIYKAADKNHWLVEISKENGVIAMPLPILASSKEAKFIGFVRSKNDLGTLNVINEFGGVPSGETFPATGTPLEDAITAGKVVRLLAASSLTTFYKRSAWSGEWGWAFSESGKSAATTCFIVDPDTGSSGTHALFGELWKVSITLSPHDVKNIPKHIPVGSGSATVTQVHRGRYANSAFFAPSGGTLTNAVGFLSLYSSFGSSYMSRYTEGEGGWGCYIWACYEGETMHHVRNTVARVVIGQRAQFGDPPFTPGISGESDVSYDMARFVLRTMFTSPGGFASDQIDLRREGVAPGDEAHRFIARYDTPLADLTSANFGPDPISSVAYSSTIWAYFPTRCREAYMIERREREGSLGVRTPYHATPIDNLETTVDTGILHGGYYRPITYLPDAVVQQGYIGGIGIVGFSGKVIPVIGADWLQFPGLGINSNVTFDASVSAAKRESWVIDETWTDPATVDRRVRRKGTPVGLQDSTPPDVNHVGSV